MTELLDEIRQELQARLKELKPLAEEYDRLETELARLRTADAPAKSSPGLPPSEGERRPARPAPPRATWDHSPMSAPNTNWIAGFIWGIADDVLRDLYVRGKYRDVILPMTVLRRLDAVLEPTKQAVLDLKASLDDAGVVNQDAALCQASGQAVYNSSTFTLRDLRGRASQQQLRADFEAYLDGFSSNGSRHS